MTQVVPVHVDIIGAFVVQAGAILVALVTAFGAAVVAWLHGRRVEQKKASSSTAETNGLHDHLTKGFQALMDEAKEPYESLLQKYREFHEERSRRIDELTAEVHGLRAEVVHLRQIMAQHGIPLPPRASA